MTTGISEERKRLKKIVKKEKKKVKRREKVKKEEKVKQETY
jgi:hypothetical protein